MVSVNRKRDRAAGGVAIDEKRGAEAGMKDVTEVSTGADWSDVQFENPDFRYVL